MERKRRSTVENKTILGNAITVSRFLHGSPMRASDAAVKAAFTAARGARGKKVACDDMRRALPAALRRQVKCSAKFIHFDSSNITHAGAIFKVTLRGPAGVINEARHRLEEAGFLAIDFPIN